METVFYKPLDGKDGFELQNNILTVCKDGYIVKEKEDASLQGKNLQQVLNDYLPLQIFPELNFVFTPIKITELQINVTSSIPLTLFGNIWVNGIKELWQAHYTESFTFQEANNLPVHVRSWAKDEEEGKGWLFNLPLSLLSKFTGDPCIEKRALLALELFVYSLQNNQEIDIPFERKFTNVFSQTNPLWKENIPLLDRK